MEMIVTFVMTAWIFVMIAWMSARIAGIWSATVATCDLIAAMLTATVATNPSK